MPTFYLMRHGQAEMHATSDAERRLTAYGRSYTQQIADQLAHVLNKYKKTLPVIIHSPYVRANETAQIICDAIRPGSDTVSQNSQLSSGKKEFSLATPDNQPQVCFDALNEYENLSFLLVSHMPLLASLSSLLEHGNSFQPHPFQTSELRCYDIDQWMAGTARFNYRLL